MIPPAWPTDGGRLGVIGHGLANELGIDRWYKDMTFIPSDAMTIPRDSLLRTYQDQTLQSILDWALVSITFDKIHRQIIADHESQAEEIRRVRESQILQKLGNKTLKWTMTDVREAKERMEQNFFKNEMVPYSLFRLSYLSATDLYEMINNDAPELNSAADTTAFNPWRAPGSAPIDSPCGVFGGNYNGCPDDVNGSNPEFFPFGDCPGGGSSYGPKGESIHYPNVKKTGWQPGATVEVGWSVSANHGGGYSYRLCQVPKGGKLALTEECFQQKPLQFEGDTSWIQKEDNVSSRVPFIAVRTNVGTVPPGSEWTKNPVPPCHGASGGLGRPALYGNDTEDKCEPQFEPIKKDGWQMPMGFGVHEFEKFIIVDKVRLPEDLAPGLYVLSHRWDCEQTPQVWTSCSDVRIEKARTGFSEPIMV